MNIILLEKVRNLGSLGENVAVKAGYARNFLIPQGKAVFATAANLEHFEQRRSELEAKEQEKLQQAGSRVEALAALGDIELTVRASDEGKLFGSLGTQDIATAIVAQGVEIAKSEIRLPEGPLRQIGEHTVAVSFHTDVKMDITVILVSESK